MMAFLAGLMPGRALAALGVVLALLAGSYWAGYSRADSKRVAEVESLRSSHAAARIAVEQAARETSEAYRAKEQQQVRERAEREAQHAVEVKALQTRVAVLAARSDGLRNDLRAAAAACGSTAGDPATACREYAAALGDLLAQFRATGLQAAQAAESHARDVDRLLAEWPK